MNGEQSKKQREISNLPVYQKIPNIAKHTSTGICTYALSVGHGDDDWRQVAGSSAGCSDVLVFRVIRPDR